MRSFVPGSFFAGLAALGLLAVALGLFTAPRGTPAGSIAPPGGTLPALHGERIGATGAYEREYWYEYERSHWEGARRVFPPGAEIRALQREDRNRAGLGFPRAENQYQQEVFNLGWKELGPRGMIPGSPFGEGHFSGRVDAVLPQPGKNRLLLGAASGGIWRRLLSEGSPFSPRSDHAASLSIGALTADPNQPQVLYAGTGEPGISISCFAGAGLLRSTNGGSSWKRIDNGIFTGQRISNVWVDPANSARLLVSLLSHPASASIGALFESLDGGVQWNPLPVGGSGLTFAVSPGDHGRILFSRSHPMGTTTADLLLSTNGGASFNEVHGPWTGTGKLVGRIDLAFAPSSPSLVWASVAPPRLAGPGQDSGKAGIYLSVNGGASFDFVYPSQHLTDGGPSIGWYSNPIAVDPTAALIIYVGGRRLYRSTLSGLEPITQYVTFGPDFMHPDLHAILFDPADPATLYVGCDGGRYVSHDGGASWLDLNDGLGITQFYYGCVGTDNGLASLLGGTQDNGSCRPWNGQEWIQPYGDDGFQCAVHPQDNQVLYATKQQSRYGLSDDAGQSILSVDPPPIGADETPPFITPLAVDPNDGNRILGGAERVYRGLRQDFTVTWSAVSSDKLFPKDAAGNPTPVRRLAIPPTNSNKIYAAGGSHLSTWLAGPNVWFPLDPPGKQFITDIALDPNHPSRVYVSRSGYDGGQVMFRTPGGTWKDLTGNLPNVPANALEITFTGPGGLGIPDDIHAYVATDTGVYYANLAAPGSPNWSPIAWGLPNAHVYDVMLADHGETLVAATHGRGMWCIGTASIVKPAFVVACSAEEVLVSGEQGQGYAVFTRPPRRRQRVTLSSSNPAVLRVPESVFVPAGKVAARFSLTAGPVKGSANVAVTVTVGDNMRTFHVVVEPFRRKEG